MYLIEKLCGNCGKPFSGDGNLFYEICSDCEIKINEKEFQNWKNKLILDKSQKEVINILLRMAYDSDRHSHPLSRRKG